MSLMLETTGQVSPTKALESALREFEVALSAEQRSKFKANHSTCEATNVVVFVGEVDASVHGRRKSVANKLFPFLDAVRQFVQQFGGATDTLVSSRPAVAALVWGGIKTAIILASNVATYFDKITTMLMEIGRTCPTYAQFGHVLKDYSNVQEALCNYYAIIVRICTRIVTVQARSGMAQMVAMIAPFEAEFKSLRDELEKAEKVIQLQVFLASQQLHQATNRIVAETNLEAKQDRHALSLFRTEAQRKQQEILDLQLSYDKLYAMNARAEILTNLSTLNAQRVWSRIEGQRIVGTAEWFQYDSRFRSWRSETRSSTLWCCGTLGLGKTVLAASVIQHLIISKQVDEIVAHHFCKSEIPESLRARTIIGSIARQLLENYIQFAGSTELSTLLAQSRNSEVSDLTAMLRKHLSSHTMYLCVLDGLDECEQTDIEEVLQALRNIDTVTLKILYSGRPELEPILIGQNAFDCKMTVSESETKRDCKVFIDSTLEQCYNAGKLKLQDPMILSTIAEVLENECEGMFLWLSMFIDELCDQNSDFAILQCLDQPPPGLAELIDRKLLRLRTKINAKYAYRLLQLSGAWRRPLTVEETREMFTIESGQRQFEKQRLPNDMDSIIAACCGLVYVDEVDLTIHLVHHSIRSHLFSDDQSVRKAEFSFSKSNVICGSLCVIYLTFRDFDRQLATVAPEKLVAISAADVAKTATSGLNPKVRSAARGVLELRRLGRKADMATLTHSFVHTAKKEEGLMQTPQFFFREYARKYCTEHTTYLSMEDEFVWACFSKCAREDMLNLDTPWRIGNGATIGDDLEGIVRWALEYKHNAMLLRCVKDAVRLNSRCDWMEDIALYAISVPSYFKRHMADIIRAIPTSRRVQAMKLACLVKVWEEMKFESWPQLSAQSYADDIVALLSNLAQDENIAALTYLRYKGVDLNTHSSKVLRALSTRMEDQNLRAAKSLTAAGANDIGQTLLFHAVIHNKSRMVRALVAAGAVTNQCNTNGSTLLHEAVIHGGHSMVQLLLFYGVEVDARDHWEQTALHIACRRGRYNTAEQLILAGAVVDQTDRYGNTLLHEAARSGNVMLAKLLLPICAKNIDAVNDYGQTALHIASGKTNLDVVEVLIIAGAAVDAPGADGDPVLHNAVRRRNVILVELLLSLGAQPNAVNEKGHTALYIACDKGYLGIVEALILAGADAFYRKDMHTDIAWDMALCRANRSIISVIETGRPHLRRRDAGFFDASELPDDEEVTVAEDAG